MISSSSQTRGQTGKFACCILRQDA